MKPPQSRVEFTHHPQITKQTYTVARNLDAVVASLQKRANECVNKEQVTQTSASVGSRSKSAYHMSVDKVSPKRAELTYQIWDSNMALQPEGGLYRLAADIEAKGAKATEVTLYHGPMSGTLVNAVSEWSKGNTDSCHGYGGK
ncbi:MAG: hypothetical protein ABR570_07650 [Burkholderiales bacterium]